VSPGNGHNPDLIANLVLMFANDLAQTPAHPVAHDGAAKPARRYKARSEFFSVSNWKRAENEQRATLRTTILFDAFEFRSLRQTAAFRK